MLNELTIKNFALISELHLEFDQGLTVFTGETGAGKSILMSALGLLLGDRADKKVIRTDATQTEVNAVFSTDNNPELCAFLQELEMDDSELFIRRIVNLDGRSKAYINSVAVPMQTLRQCGEYLFDIHGQHAHHALLKKDQQRILLDTFMAEPDLLEQLKDTYQAWQEITAKLTSVQGEAGNYQAQIDLLQYQCEELTKLAPMQGEYEAGLEEYKYLNNIQELVDTTQNIYAALYESEENLIQKLTQLGTQLDKAVAMDKCLHDVSNIIQDTQVQLTEAAHGLGEYLHSLELDPQRLSTVEKRLEQLQDCARKHQVNVKELPALLENLTEQFDSLQHNNENVESWQIQQQELVDTYQKQAKQLSDKRQQAADKMALAITDKLHELGMQGSRFIIEVNHKPDKLPTAQGSDEINYLFSSNVGMSMQLLGKVASGGELSRISLAIQVIAIAEKGVMSMMFDEVDTGIGGAVAETVGQLLARLATKRQIFCVTHLPQVAYLGDCHMQVSKSQDDSSTQTYVKKLSDTERVEEIARMLGGINVSEKSLAHAREMLASRKQVA